MPPQIFPIISQLFKNREREKKIEDIMAGRWLPNTPTAEVAYQTFVERGLPIDREYAEKILDEWVELNDKGFVEEVLANRGTPQETPSTAVGEEEPSVVMAKEDIPSEPPVSSPDPVKIVRKLFGIPDEEAPEDEAPNRRPQPILSPPRPVPPLGDEEASAPQVRQVDPFIRMLQTALVMRMLGGTGGAFGALALAPILKDLFDEMMGRKKRDTGQGDGKEQPKPPTAPQNVPEERRPLLSSKPIDEVVIELYNRGLFPEQIALALPSIIEGVNLSPQQVEQILNISGVHGVHVPTTAPKKKEETGNQNNQRQQNQNNQRQQNQNPQTGQRGQNRNPQGGQRRPQGRR